MKKAMLFFIWLTCGAMFILPTLKAFAMPQKEVKCCKMSKENHQGEKVCCYEETTSQHSSSEKQHCGDSCAKVCSACFALFITELDENLTTKKTIGMTDKERNFPYLSPHILTTFQKIWKPPKISA